MSGDSLPAAPALHSPEASPPPPSFISQLVTGAQRFYLSIEKKPAGRLAVVCGGWEECAENYVVDRATFPYHSFEFVASGEGDLTLGGKHHALKAGTIFSYGPGIAQRIRTSPARRLRKYFVDFVGARARSLLVSCGLTPGSVVQIATTAELQIGLDTLIRIAGARHAETARMCALQLELLLLAIKHGTAPGTLQERRAFATFERCRQIIESEFLTLRTVEQAARRCHVERGYLSRLFHKFCGVTPLRYIRQLQMQWAAHRLHSSDALVRQVADELGIDAFHFSRMFKRIHGLAPSTFIATRS